MSSLFERWRAQGAPAALRWWIPSPAHLSRTLHEGPETSLAVTGFATLCALAVGPLAAASFAFLARGAVESAARQENAFAAAIGVAFLALMLGLPLAAGAFALPRSRPHVTRVAAALSCVAALALGLIGPVTAAAAALGVGLLAGFALLARATPRALTVLRRAAVGMLVASGAAAFALAASLAVASRADAFAAAWQARGAGPFVALVVGLVPLGLGALMFVVHRADLAPWSTPSTWQQATLGAGNVLHFANGGAPRQAPNAFGGYAGPVVVIALQEKARGAFRADGAPDDGWTVPGTLETVREAVARAEASALATVIAAFACAAAPLGAGLAGALRILFA